MRSPLAALLAFCVALPGCCGLTYGARGDRDTPERAFAFVRDAFVEDRTGDQYDSFHADFQAANGLTSTRYTLARELRPGLFSEAARLLKDARIEGTIEPGSVGTTLGTRPAARVALASPAGGRGVFVLVDEPVLRLVTDDPEAGDGPVSYPEIDRSVRMDGDTLVVTVRRKLDAPPLPTARLRRFEMHHDWQIFGIESLEGFDEFLEDVRTTAERSKEGTPR